MILCWNTLIWNWYIEIIPNGYIEIPSLQEWQCKKRSQPPVDDLELTIGTFMQNYILSFYNFCSHVGWYTFVKVLVRPVIFSVDKSAEQYQLRRVQEELVMILDIFICVLLTIVWINQLLIFFQCRHKHCSQHLNCIWTMSVSRFNTFGKKRAGGIAALISYIDGDWT